MLQIIIMESKNVAEYAQRAEAWNSAEAKPMSDKALASALIKTRPLFVKQHGVQARTIVSFIESFRTKRISNRSRMFQQLIKGAE